MDASDYVRERMYLIAKELCGNKGKITETPDEIVIECEDTRITVDTDIGVVTRLDSIEKIEKLLGLLGVEHAESLMTKLKEFEKVGKFKEGFKLETHFGFVNVEGVIYRGDEKLATISINLTSMGEVRGAINDARPDVAPTLLNILSEEDYRLTIPEYVDSISFMTGLMGDIHTIKISIGDSYLMFSLGEFESLQATINELSRLAKKLSDYGVSLYIELTNILDVYDVVNALSPADRGMVIQIGNDEDYPDVTVSDGVVEVVMYGDYPTISIKGIPTENQIIRAYELAKRLCKILGREYGELPDVRKIIEYSSLAYSQIGDVEVVTFEYHSSNLGEERTSLVYFRKNKKLYFAYYNDVKELYKFPQLLLKLSSVVGNDSISLVAISGNDISVILKGSGMEDIDLFLTTMAMVNIFDSIKIFRGRIWHKVDGDTYISEDGKRVVVSFGELQDIEIYEDNFRVIVANGGFASADTDEYDTYGVATNTLIGVSGFIPMILISKEYKDMLRTVAKIRVQRR